MSNKFALSDIKRYAQRHVGKPREITLRAAKRVPPSTRTTREKHLPSEALTLPSSVAGSGTLDRLVDTARDYARAAHSENTNKAYAKDWKHFGRWCRKKGAEPLPPSPEMIGLYLADLAAPDDRASAMIGHDNRTAPLRPCLALPATRLHPRSQEPPHRHRAGRDQTQTRATTGAERGDPARRHSGDGGHPALRPAGLRDRAILLLGYAGGLRRSEIVSLDVHKDDTPDSGGWIEIMDEGALLTLNAKTGWREVEIGRGS